MADQTALVGAFADFARTIPRDGGIGEVLCRLTDQAVDVLDDDGRLWFSRELVDKVGVGGFPDFPRRPLRGLRSPVAAHETR